MDKLERFLERAERLMDKLERILPRTQTAGAPDWNAAHAFRWERSRLVPVQHPHCILLADLIGIDRQKQLIEQNTRQFVQGRTANNVLLTGARGTGKSSLVKALLNEFSSQGLRLIEVGKLSLSELPHIIALVAGRAERFILYCDDLSFSADEPGYQALKAALDGSLVAFSDNLLIYATSNRRSSPDPGIDAGESCDEIYWRRDTSGRKHRGKDFIVRTIRPLVVVLSVLAG